MAEQILDFREVPGKFCDRRKMAEQILDRCAVADKILDRREMVDKKLGLWWDCRKILGNLFRWAIKNFQQMLKISLNNV